MKTVIYTTVRVEIEHPDPFATKQDVYNFYCDQFDFEQSKIDVDDNAVLTMEWVGDEIVNYNMEEQPY
jgi:hypothetical protein